jgi:hypothetical protein
MSVNKSDVLAAAVKNVFNYVEGKPMTVGKDLAMNIASHNVSSKVSMNNPSAVSPYVSKDETVLLGISLGYNKLYKGNSLKKSATEGLKSVVAMKIAKATLKYMEQSDKLL